MDVGVLVLPLAPWDALRSRWQWAEHNGAAHAWTFDHLIWRGVPQRPWLGAVPVLTAAACITTTLRLGTLVSSANFRCAVPFAKEVVSIDHISGGRLTLGLGAGAGGFDAEQRTAAGRSRADDFAAFVEDLHRLLGPDRAAHPAGLMEPGPAQTPRLPLAIAATRERGLRLAAWFGDYWVTNGFSPAPGRQGPQLSVAEVSAQAAAFDRLCDELGRSHTGIRRMLVVGNPVETRLDKTTTVRRLIATYGDLGFTDVVLPYPLDDDERGLDVLGSILAEHRCPS
jgi:alkanesulfonate monooxygenase SsuD/methylene tetrahydromethanopterin reductase-like flavin-dependent oxidoreductase (luciferase family)